MAIQERAADGGSGLNPYEPPSPAPVSPRGSPAIAWGVTWLAYASYYAGRKCFSASKKKMRDELGITETALGAIDTAFLAAYAIGQFVSGALGDRIGPRRLVSAGMLLSAAACGAFAHTSTVILFGVFFLVNGLAQATGWPGTTRAMAEWTTLENRGTVMSFWATCYQLGGMAATAACGFILVRYGWRSTFLAAAAWMALIGIVVFALLRPGPGSGATVVDEVRSPEVLAKLRRDAQKEVLKSPALWSYGASYFFIKFVRYAILLWMPYYLANTLHYANDDANYISIAFEVGGALGVIALGILSDRLRRYSRPFLSLLSLIGLGFALLLYWRVETSGWVANVLALSLIGALLFAPDSLLSGASAQDAGGPHAAAMAAGMVNGVGSVGALVESLTVPQLSKHFGWGVVFPVLAGMAFCAALALVPSLFAKKVY